MLKLFYVYGFVNILYFLVNKESILKVIYVRYFVFICNIKYFIYLNFVMENLVELYEFFKRYFYFYIVCLF